MLGVSFCLYYLRLIDEMSRIKATTQEIAWPNIDCLSYWEVKHFNINISVIMNERQKKEEEREETQKKINRQNCSSHFFFIASQRFHVRQNHDKTIRQNLNHNTNQISFIKWSILASCLLHTHVQLVESNDKAEMLLIFPDIYTENSVNNNDNTRFDSIVRDFV